MKYTPETTPPVDAQDRKNVAPVICYPVDPLPRPDMSRIKAARADLAVIDTHLIAPRDASCFEVPAGHFFRISCPDGPQVGDLNLWSKSDLNEKFYSGKTRALHGTHLSTGDQMWSSFPHFRPMATISHDTLDWYGWDEFGGSVHDVIGTRCDPYTNRLLSNEDYHYCCHSNLIRALSSYTGQPAQEIEHLVHDVLNVFMCTGFTLDTHQYFMKASPVRQGDYLEFLAEIDLVGGLSACPGGDCSEVHSSDKAACYPLQVDILKPADCFLESWDQPPKTQYSQTHGLK